MNDEEWRIGLGERLDKQDKLLAELKITQDKQGKALEAVSQNTQTAVDFFQTMDGAMKFFNFVGKIAKPFIWTAGTVATIYAAWKGVK